MYKRVRKYPKIKQKALKTTKTFKKRGKKLLKQYKNQLKLPKNRAKKTKKTIIYI